MSAQLPTVIGPEGLVPQAPADIREQLLTQAAIISPGYTARLPGLLIEDVSSTAVAGIALCDAARVEVINSLSAEGANDFLLALLGRQAGITSDQVTNTSVDVIFYGPVGYIIAKGFLVSDGQYTYSVQDGGVINSSNQSQPLTCVATTSGSWQISTGSVSIIRSSVPSITPITCSNPSAGIPGVQLETSGDFRARVMQAQKASAQGMPSFTKTLIENVPGVIVRLVSIQQKLNGGWRVIVGGGDAFDVAYAIYRGMLDISQLQPSIISVANITNGPNAVVTTDYNHGLINGQVAYVNGIMAGMLGINGIPLTVTVIDDKNFSTGADSSLYGVYTSGGSVTPNSRNVAPAVIEFPDMYTVPFIRPPSQSVAINLLWNTNLPGYINEGAIAQLAQPALAAYVNSIYAGQPLNLYDMENAFRDAITSVLPGKSVSRMVFQVSLNGQGTPFDGATGLLSGDSESYFLTNSAGSQITVSRG